MGLVAVLAVTTGGLAAYALVLASRLRRDVRRLDHETHFLSEKLDYLRRELDKLDPDRQLPRSEFGPDTPSFAPPGSAESPLPAERFAPVNEPPLRLPSPRGSEAVAVDMGRKTEIIPGLQPLAAMLKEEAHDAAEPTVLPGSEEPDHHRGAAPQRDNVPAMLTALVCRIKAALGITGAGGQPAEPDDAVTARWMLCAGLAMLVAALVGFLVYLLPSMESEYVTIMGCVAGMAALSASVAMADRGAVLRSRLAVVLGLALTAVAMYHGAWISGVVPVSLAVAILAVMALACLVGGERQGSVLVAGAGLAVALATPMVMLVNEVSPTCSLWLCVALAISGHLVLLRRPWPLLRAFAVLYTYGFIGWAVLTQGARGIAATCIAALAHHGLVCLGEATLPRWIRTSSFWLALLAVFFSVALEISGMFAAFASLQMLVTSFLLLLAVLALVDRVAERADDPAGTFALVLCLAGMFLKVLFVDLPVSQPGGNLVYQAPYSTSEAAARLLNMGMVVVALGLAAWRLAGRVMPSLWKSAATAAFLVAFLGTTFDINTYLHLKRPGFQGAGLSLAWGAFGVMLTWAGGRVGGPLLRQLGWLLLGVIIIKLLLIDMRGMEPLSQVVAMSGVGLLVFAGALPYLRTRTGVSPGSDQGGGRS